MISVAAVVIALAAVGVGEGIILLHMPPSPVTILGSLIGIGVGSSLIILTTGWWMYGSPPPALPIDMIERIMCHWEHGAHYCRETMGPPRWS